MRSSAEIFREIEDQIIAQLRRCIRFRELNRIHAQILVSFLSQSSFLATQIINVCNANGKIDYAHRVFSQVLDPNIFLYNAMIKACSQNLHFLDAVLLYRQMLRRSKVGDRFTYPFVLKSCAGIPRLQLGKQVHLRAIISGLDSNPIVNNSVLEMYTKGDDLENARKVFDEIPLKDSISWNTLITGHGRLGQMRKAKAIFDAMPDKTIVSWTAMISGYSATACYSEAIAFFRRMQMEGFEPDDISIVSVLPACANLGALELGNWIHAYCIRQDLLRKTFVSNALIEFHSRCGSIEQALQVFHGMHQTDVISWSTMIGGLAMHGRAREAVKLFIEMEEEGRVRPNGVTFLGLLTACVHGGLLKEGLNYFSLMKEVYRIEAGVEHYGCVIDLLSRSGCVHGAVEVVENMPFPADAAIWGSLLSACRLHGKIEVAVMAMENLARLKPDELGNYVILSNIYAGERMWDDVARMRGLIRSRRLKKEPGCSSIEVENRVAEFMSGDDSHVRSVEFDDMLNMIATVAGEGEALNGLEYVFCTSF